MPSLTKKLLDINSWDEFFSFANSLSANDKGNIFESLTKLILTTKPEYSSILKKVWLHNEDIPKEIREKLNLPTTDEGIDLVAETYTGKYWAIQCKFKGQNQPPNYKELSTFGNLANSYCKNISLALLVHTGEKGVRKKKLLGENYTEIGLDFWLGLTVEDWASIHKKLQGLSVRPTPKAPRPHQEKAILNATDHYHHNNATRGRMIMPCGTGKSLTAFWIAQALVAKTIIVAVPSLALIKQTLEDWTREFLAHKEEPRPEWLVICSDESTGNLEKDEFVSDTYSMGIPTTTDVKAISSFLSQNYEGRKVIFTTYQSSDKLAQASSECGFTFDLAILDEAHKTVGVKSKSFATLLSDNNIRISRRIFMTATERVIRGNDDEVYSMDDTDIYGDMFYQLSFKDAIHSTPPIISDYKVLTISVTNEEIKQLITKNKLISDNDTKLEEQEAQSFAAAIALRKATEKYGIKHAISFHRSIKSADDFSELNKKLNQENIDNIQLSSSHISSKKSAGERARLLTDFAEDQLALMTNARCLTEGVDVPAIDCVLFADPKQSTIDIVQATGRALRPFAGKEFGYIMLPLIVPDDVSLEEFTESTPFKQVARIIAALSTQDEGIAEEFRITRDGRTNGGRKIIIDGTVPVGLKLDISSFASTINAKIWERVAKVNWRPFDEARAFVHELKLKNNLSWRKYSESSDKPHDIPITPENVYKEWISWGDWLGTGTIANYLRDYLPFNEARSIVHKLNLKSFTEWIEFCKSGKKPENIPAFPNQTYNNKGWAGNGDWLGTGTIAAYLREYRGFMEARAFVHSLNINSAKEWGNYCKKGLNPKDIPAKPSQTYKEKGWVNWGDWLGTNVVAAGLRQYRSFGEARDFVHTLNIKNSAEWWNYCTSGKKPNDIPSNPNSIYKNKGWKGIGDWLGTGAIASFLRNYLPFEDARIFVHSLDIKNQKEWKNYSKKGNKPYNIPANPNQVYQNNGWAGFGDWLGTGIIASYDKKFRTFKNAREFVRSLNLKSGIEWRKYCASGNKPLDIPSNPDKKYINEGWKGMGDWLG